MSDIFNEMIATISTEYEVLFSREKIILWKNGLIRFADDVLQKTVYGYIASAEGKYPPRLSNIIQNCEILCGGSGWLDADEAWARAPKSEMDSAMVTDEIVEAIAAARDQLEQKERIAARMTFKSAYERLTARAKLEGRAPVYFLSSGGERSGREHALVEGVRMGQIQIDHAVSLVAPERAEFLISASQIDNHPLLAPPSQVGLRHLKSLMLTLKIKKLPPADDEAQA